MSSWKKLSFSRSKSLHRSLMLLAARQAMDKGILDFSSGKWHRDVERKFILNVGEGLLGSVKLNPLDVPRLVKVEISFPNIDSVGYFKEVAGHPEIYWMFETKSKYGIPQAFVDLAMNPISTEEAFG